MKDKSITDQAHGGRQTCGRFSLTAWLSRYTALAGLCVLVLTAACGARGESPALTEYQVKALFLLNFTRYVEWPSEALLQVDSPIVIGVLGDEKFCDQVKAAVAGKAVNGRPIEVRQFTREDDCTKCHILFISAAEKKHVSEILEKVKAAPILTVGETDQFAGQGGIINFIVKEGKVRLEIDLNAARLAKLELSSKLLSVADNVHGKS